MLPVFRDDIDDPERGTIRLLARLKGRVVAIGGADRGTYERRGYLDALDAQIVQGIFGYCGIEAAGLDLLLPLDANSEAEGLQRAFEIGQDLSGRTS